MPQPPSPPQTRPGVDIDRGVTPADFAIGTVLGAAGATQGVALPGTLALGFGYDALIAGVSAAVPAWFPRGSLSLSPEKVLATGVGVVVGWGLLKILAGNGSPPAWAPAALAIGASLVGGGVGASNARVPYPQLQIRR